MAKPKSYKKLYLRILRIGVNRVHEGVTYNELKAELVKQGYDFENDCIELSVKQWFYDSFNHTGADDNPYTSVKDLENHLDCSFILKGESCLKLLSYETSRNSWRNGIAAITLSLIAVSVAIYINFWRSPATKMDNTKGTNSTELEALNRKVDILINRDTNNIEPIIGLKSDTARPKDITKPAAKTKDKKLTKK